MNISMTEVTLNKIHSLLVIYEQLLQFMRDAHDERFIDEIESIAESLTQIKNILAMGVDSKTHREILKGIRQGLRETPRVFKSTVPEHGVGLIAEFESLIGRRFSDL